MKSSGHINNGNGTVLPGNDENFMIIAGRQPLSKSTHRRANRRNCKRYQPIQNTFALLRNNRNTMTKVEDMSLGELGFAVMRSGPCLIGEIRNMSPDGLGFFYIDEETQLEGIFTLDILAAECRFYLSNLFFKTISDVEISDDWSYGSFKVRSAGVQLFGMTPSQNFQLEEFIRMNIYGEP